MKPWPDSPRKLLEARYQAFVKGDVDFILESTHPSVRSRHDRQAITEWSSKAKWLDLNIEEETGEEDRGWIRFTVQYEEGGQLIDHRERAEFRKEDGRWLFYDSTFPKQQPIRRAAEKVGRNDPCPCGSGKKFKKCCAA